VIAKFSTFSDRVGRATFAIVEEVGHGALLFLESFYWLLVGWRRNQPVRIDSIFVQMMEMGVRAVPIVTVLAGTIGVMLAIQGIYTLRTFGAESRVVVGIALSITREFSPLITGILIAGRSGSALAARLSTMKINQEVDALCVIGINPVRFLVAPALVAMMIMLPILTIWSDIVGLFVAGIYVSLDLGISMAAYIDQTVDVLKVDDVMHGLQKTIIFAILITLVGVASGNSVTGGAEGVGRVTTRSVVVSITLIVIADMLFAFLTTR
jgi:phospholipid/cholesterol/gamma-HCH transport system permease protein